MKFEGSGSKGTRVIEQKRSVTDGQTDKAKKKFFPQGGGGGRHNQLVKHESPVINSFKIMIGNHLVYQQTDGPTDIPTDISRGPNNMFACLSVSLYHFELPV